MRLLGCLLMLVFVGFFVVASFGLSVIQLILRMLGVDVRSRSTLRSNDEPKQPDAPTPKRKFPDEEGEYIDFEEVSVVEEKS